MADEITTAEQAVEKAVTQQTPEPEPEPESESKTDSDPRVTQALELLEALEDPSRSKSVIQHLAQQAGLLEKDEKLTKKEEKQIRAGIKDIAKKHFGEEFSILSERVANVLEEVLADKEKEFESKLQELERKRAEETFMVSYNNFLSENKVTEEEAGIMLKLAEEITPSPTASLPKYLNRLLSLARSEQAASTKSKVIQERKANNQQRKAETLGVEGSSSSDKFPKYASPRDAVLAAMKGITLED